MKEHQTPHVLASRVRMMRTSYKGTILVVEGDSDARVYKRFTDENACMIIHACGKENAVGALKILENDSFQGILVIVDADFQRLEGYMLGSMSLLLTDTHDLETMILSTPAEMEKVLAAFGSTTILGQLPGYVINMVIDNALLIGYFSWIASPSKDNLMLKFKDLRFENFVEVNKAKLHIDIDKLINAVKKNSGGIKFDEKALKRKIESLKKQNHDPWQVCCGHDMVQILAIGFRFVFGKKKAATFTAEILEGTLRVAYEYSYFCLTALHRSIKNWEKVNPAYKVLKN
jgi:hypothetical protein